MDTDHPKLMHISGFLIVIFDIYMIGSQTAKQRSIAKHDINE